MEALLSRRRRTGDGTVASSWASKLPVRIVAVLHYTAMGQLHNSTMIIAILNENKRWRAK
jgi:hypothetical protein